MCLDGAFWRLDSFMPSEYIVIVNVVMYLLILVTD